MSKKTYNLTKKIAKHGSQAIIIVPIILEDKLKPGTIVQMKLEVLEGIEN